MKKQLQNGFGVIGIIVIVGVVAAVAFFGYMFWQQQNKSNPVDVQQVDLTNAPTIEIKEWGVKIPLRDADKVQFTVINEAGELPSGLKFDAVAATSFKPQFLKNKDCTPGLSLYRSAAVSEGLEQKKIGDYYYSVTGGPSVCSNNPDTDPDDLLKDRVVADFKLENVTLK